MEASGKAPGNAWRRRRRRPAKSGAQVVRPGIKDRMQKMEKAKNRLPKRKAVSVSKKSACGVLFRMLTPFPSRPCGAPGRETAQGSLARQGPNPPHMSPDSDCIWRTSALQTSRKGFLTVWDALSKGVFCFWAHCDTIIAAWLADRPAARPLSGRLQGLLAPGLRRRITTGGNRR